VIFATEQMDEDAGWRMLEPGELVRVDGDRQVTCAGARSRSRRRS